MPIQSPINLLHGQEQDIVVRIGDGPKVVSRKCFINQHLSSPHLILNQSSISFFKEWTNCIIEHYISIIQSLTTTSPLQIFNLSLSLTQRVPKRSIIIFIENLLKSQIEVHKGNINFVNDSQNIQQVKNPFFMNDLLNFFHEPAQSNVIGLTAILENNIKSQRINVFPGDINLDHQFLKSLENAKSVLKQKYINDVQLQIHKTQTPQFKQSMKIQIPTKQQAIEIKKQDYNTPRRQGIQLQSQMNQKTQKRVQHKRTQRDTSQKEWTQHVQIADSRYGKQLQNLINKLQEQNCHLKQWKKQMEDYLNQMTLKIQQLTPRNQGVPVIKTEINSILPINKQKSQDIKFMKNLQEKIIGLQLVAQNQQIQLQKMHIDNQNYSKHIIQLQSLLELKDTQLNQKQNKLGLEIKGVEDMYRKKLTNYESTITQLINKNRSLNDQINNKDHIINQLTGKISKTKDQNNRIIQQHNKHKNAVQKQHKKQRVGNNNRNQSVQEIALQIKQKMNKINTIIKVSSMPDLRKNHKSTSSNSQQKPYEINRISPKLPPVLIQSAKLKQNEQELAQKNKEISELKKVNMELKKMSESLQNKIEQLERNSKKITESLQTKLFKSENKNQLCEAKIESLKKQVAEILSQKNSMIDQLDNKELIINKLNQKVINLQQYLKGIQKNSKGQEFNQQLLQQVIMYEADIQRKKVTIQKIIKVCQDVITKLKSKKHIQLSSQIHQLQTTVQIAN